MEFTCDPVDIEHLKRPMKYVYTDFCLLICLINDFKGILSNIL